MTEENKNLVDEIKKYFDEKTEETKRHFDVVAEDLQSQFKVFGEKLSDVETKVDSLETKVDSLETKVDSLETKVDSLETKVDLLIEDMDYVKSELVDNKDKFKKIDAELEKKAEKKVFSDCETRIEALENAVLAEA